MDLFHTDLTYFADRVPVVKDIGTIFFAVGWALLIGNLVFQAMCSMGRLALAAKRKNRDDCFCALRYPPERFFRLAADVRVDVHTDGLQSDVCQAADQRNAQCTERHGHYPVDDADCRHCPHGKKDGRHYFTHWFEPGADLRSAGYAFSGMLTTMTLRNIAQMVPRTAATCFQNVWRAAVCTVGCFALWV